MSRNFQRGALLTAAFSLVATASFARQPVVPASADLTGKYALPADGYLVVSVDDRGRVEGFFERNGVFGRVSGKVEGDVASATWVQERGSTACSTQVDGSQYWGALTLTRDADGVVQTSWSECKAALPSASQTR